MPARDRYHDQVKNALIKDGWTITDDPLHVKWGRKDMYVDLGAERLLAAEKGERKIAVEVKSFLGPSEMSDLEQSVSTPSMEMSCPAPSPIASCSWPLMRRFTTTCSKSRSASCCWRIIASG
jgi:hypothetical protein